jgi:two-component system nitrogen regulation response regulator GlnG
MPNVSNFPVLIIDDELQYLQSAAVVLRVSGFDVVTVSEPGKIAEVLGSRLFGVILLDFLMPGVRGDEVLMQIQHATPGTPVIMVTAVNELETAVQCMRLGAFDYLVKPVEKDRLVTTVRTALEMVELRFENRRLKEGLLGNQLKRPEIFEAIVTRDPKMIAIFRYIEVIAQSPMPVLIRGETGTGKELIAQAIHRASGRNGEFVCVNAAGIADVLLSDTLFGHEKGAFTGADSRRAGLVSKAAKGTLFLDEIGDMAIESQTKLLRLLEERTYYPTGSDTPRTSDARIVVATNKDLDSMRKDGRFRDDLYYRLEAHIIEIPSLQQRRCDLPLLVDHFCELAAQQLGKEVPVISSEFYNVLGNYSFPGNIRELRNVMTDAVCISEQNRIDYTLLPQKFAVDKSVNIGEASPEFNQETLKRWQVLPAIKDAELLLIDEALRRSNGNQTMAAQLLGMTRSALNKRLTRAKQE